MPIKLFDRVKQKTTTSGSGTITLGDSVDAFLDFSSVFSNGDQTFYTIESPTIFEVGIGTYNAGTISRDTILKSSNSDQLVNLVGDLNTYIFVTYPASGSVFSTGTGNTYIEDYGTITYIDAQDNIVSGYVVSVSGNLQSQITSNDTDISNLQSATGNLDTRVTQNTNDIVTVSGIAQGAADDVTTASGYLQGQITSNDSDITALQTATGNLDTRVTQNASDIVTVSGIAQDAADDVASASGYLQGQITSNDGDITALQTATGNLDTRVTQNTSDIVTVSGIAQDASDDVATASGYLQGQITSNDSDITALQTATGNLDTRVTQNTNDINTVSGLIITYSAESGIELIGSTFIMGGTGNLDQLNITSIDSNQVPLTIIGAVAQAENLQEWQDSSSNVVAYVDKEGNALFSGLTTLGDLNVSGALTYIHSSNVTIADKQLELASNSGSPISGDAYIDEGGIVLKSTNGDKEWIWRDSTDAWTSNQNINVGSNSVIFDGISQTIAYTGQEQVVSGNLQSQIDQNASDITTVSGIAQSASDDVVSASGYLQGQITSNDSDITALQTATGNLDTRVTQNTSDIVTVSGIAQGAADDVTTASGYLQGQITSNDGDITALQTATGVLRTDIDSNDIDISALQSATGNLDVRVTQNTSDIATSSGYLQGQITSNDSDITDLQTATGNLDTRVTQNTSDIVTVSGIAQDATNDVVIVSGLLYNNWNISVTGNSDSITSNETVTLTGLGYTSITYDESTNTIYVSGDGSDPTGYDWNLSITGLTDTIASGDTVTLTGLGLTSITYNPSTNVISISGSEATFDDDLLVSLSDGKTFGRYPDGATIPASGKTAREVIELSIAEPIAPTVSLTSPTTVAFNQTGISNTLNFSHTINSVGASVSSASLEFRRGGVGSWTTLSTSTTTPDSFVHSFTDTNFNTSGMNYRYIVTDSLGASNTGTKTITPASYSAPSISWNLVGNALSGVETNTKRERGNVDSQINGTVTRNSVNVDLISYTIQYNVDGGGWTDIGSASIGPGSDTIASTGHDPTSDNTANQIQYRIQVVDEYQQYLSSQVTSSTKTISFLFLIFYGPLSAAPTTSNEVRAIATQIFTDGSNPFNLNTGSTLKDFTVAMPNTLSISQVLDLDALSANITASYVNNPFNVNDAGGTAVAYNVYTMSNSVPYSSNHRHEVTRS